MFKSKRLPLCSVLSSEASLPDGTKTSTLVSARELQARDCADVADKHAEAKAPPSSPAPNRFHARLLRDLVEYVNDCRAGVSTLEAWPNLKAV